MTSGQFAGWKIVLTSENVTTERDRLRGTTGGTPEVRKVLQGVRGGTWRHISNLVPTICLFAGYLMVCHYITREQAYSGNEIADIHVCHRSTCFRYFYYAFH